MIKELKQLLTQEHLDRFAAEFFQIPQKPDYVNDDFICRIPALDVISITCWDGWENINLAQPLPDGLFITSLREAARLYPDWWKRYGMTQEPLNNFAAFNRKYATQGIFIYVAPNTTVKLPIQILNLMRQETPAYIQLQNIIAVGENSRLQVIQCDDSFNLHCNFANHCTHVFMEQGAQLDYHKLQNVNNESGIMNTIRFFLQQDAHLDATCVSLNGSYVRNDIQVLFLGEHASANVNGLYLADRNQKVYNNIKIEHQKPHCTSQQNYKGILDDAAESAFKGYIKVYPHAFQTDARQNNRNILLTDKAKIDSQPFLEIDNDDVKCSHGVTVGNLDGEALYYMRTRGIGKQQATLLLMYAFCAEIIGKIKITSLKEYLSLLVTQRLNGELNPCINCALPCERGICK